SNPAHDAGGISRDDGHRRHVLADQRARAHHGSGPDADAGQDDRPHADPDIIADGDGPRGLPPSEPGGFTIGDHDLMRDEDVVADSKLAFDAQDGADQRAIVADRDLRGGAELEERAVVDAGVAADADRCRRGGVQERIGADQKAARSDLEAGGQIAREPVVRQPAAQGAFSVTSGGLPAAHAPGGTSRASTVPGAMVAPSPIVTPLRMMAPVPIHTLRPITTGAAGSGGRRARSPLGATATASRRRASSSMG